MIGGLLGRSVRGKCRYCDSSVSQEYYGWAGESGGAEPYDCSGAPWVQCPPCAGLGKMENVEVPREHPDRWMQCQCCRGRGEVPGPHWPWRHPPLL